MAATFCHRVRASRLILTHFSQRYRRLTDESGHNAPEATVDKLVHDAQDMLCRLGDIGCMIEVSAADDLKVYQILAKK